MAINNEGGNPQQFAGYFQKVFVYYKVIVDHENHHRDRKERGADRKDPVCGRGLFPQKGEK